MKIWMSWLSNLFLKHLKHVKCANSEVKNVKKIDQSQIEMLVFQSLDLNTRRINLKYFYSIDILLELAVT